MNRRSTWHSIYFSISDNKDIEQFWHFKSPRVFISIIFFGEFFMILKKREKNLFYPNRTRGTDTHQHKHTATHIQIHPWIFHWLPDLLLTHSHLHKTNLWVTKACSFTLCCGLLITLHHLNNFNSFNNFTCSHSHTREWKQSKFPMVI